MGSKMIWLLISLVINLSSCDLLEARHEKIKLPSAVVVGTVFCDTCFQEKLSNTSHFISGATVAVECGSGGPKPSFREEVKTDKKGEFKVHLPVSVSKHVKKIEECNVQLIKSSEPYCAVAAAATSSSLQLKSRKEGTHIFSASFFTFKPLKQPNLCNQKPSIKHSETLDDTKAVIMPLDYPSLPSPIQDPAVPNIPRIYDNLPPIPFLPGLPLLPQLPPLPPLPGFPRYPPKETVEKEPTPTPTAASKTSEKTDQDAVFQSQTFFSPIVKPKKPWKPHFVLPPHKPFKPPFIPKILLLPPPSSWIPSPTPPAGGSAPSPPSPPPPSPPTSSYFFFSPSVPGSPWIPSTTKQGSP